MSKEELEKIFDDNKAVLDRLGKKETTDQDIWNFIRVIERNLIINFFIDLNKILMDKVHNKNTVVVSEIIKNWEKKLKR